ncbi:phosphotyrosine protein phosphatase [Erythrobacter sp. F6033]|nr:phosphotyrosine protein phosphatase [Erythrobacter sp. F6033]
MEPPRGPRRFLFVCTKNKLRSPTAEQVFSQIEGIEAFSAGISRDAEEPLTDELIEWADHIFVMERAHRAKIQSKHRVALKDTRIAVLGIPDEYRFMDPALIHILETKMRRWLPDT